MKIASYIAHGRESFGLVLDDGILDLRSRLEPIGSVLELLQRGALDKASAIAAGAKADLALADVELLPPVPRPGKILCVGINYRSRPGEFQKAEEPKYPSLFMRGPTAQVGHLQPLLLPPESEQLDYEGEIALIIGRKGRRIAEADALSHVAGFACFNEASIRDWMKHGVYNVTAGKNWDASGGFGPWLATPDEVGDPGAIRISTRVNGETVQDDNTANMIAPFQRLIAYISTFTTLEPGDVIATGTPAGTGSKMNPPRWLKAGDVVEVEVAGVGILRNTVRVDTATA
jgi:5-carboxymethyl-2-hydroxymuconate isomerase